MVFPDEGMRTSRLFLCRANSGIVRAADERSELIGLQRLHAGSGYWGDHQTGGPVLFYILCVRGTGR